MRYPDASVALALMVLFGLAPIGAQQGRANTIPCSEKTTRIDGMDRRVRLTGACETVVVSGSGHRIVVERAGTLNVSGIDNEVRWEHSLQGDAPRVLNSGIKNVVTRVTRVPAPPRATTPTNGAQVSAKAGDGFVVKQSGQTLHFDCASRPVTVSGSANTITLSGTCGQIAVSGTGNRITVERAPRIVTTGHNNEIVWQYGDGDQLPTVKNSGRNNTVRRAGL